MPVAAVVAIAVAVVIIGLLAYGMLRLARTLVDIDRRLGATMEAVGAIATGTAPMGPAVESMERSLESARELLSSQPETPSADDPRRPEPD